jgi:glucose/arabinose dehydrogenase
MHLYFQSATLAAALLAAAHALAEPISQEVAAILPDGYFIEPVATRFDFPTGIALDNAGTFWVSEAGFMPPFVPKIKRFDHTGAVTTILTATDLAQGVLEGPLTDITYHAGMLWVMHRQIGANGWRVGAVSRFDPANPLTTFTTLLTNLPSSGDHHTNEIVFGSDGRAYFAIGTATNSSVIGPDNEIIEMWLANFPTFHDFAPRPLALSGVDYQTPVPFSLDLEADDVTGPFMPFGSGPVAAGAIVPAATPATPQQGMIAGNGTVYSFDPAAASPATTLMLEAWGLRNPFGLGIDPFDPRQLFVSNNGSDIRTAMIGGQLQVAEPRPISNDLDDMFVVAIGGQEEFFGWPDYFHHPGTGVVLPVTDPLFCAAQPPIVCPAFVLDAAFRATLDVEPSFAQLENHSSATKFDFSRSDNFGYRGDLFVSESGAFVPSTGAMQFTGYNVVVVDRDTGRVAEFLRNPGTTPQTLFDPCHVNKPIDVKFWGELMFVVDFGVFEPGLMIQQAGTGKVWIVTHGRTAMGRFLNQ